jgi:hypothetical protein
LIRWVNAVTVSDHGGETFQRSGQRSVGIFWILGVPDFGRVLRECRMVRHRVFQTKPAEPAVGEVQVHFLAQPTLGADAKAVADDQHANQQGWIDRRATGVAVVRCEVLMQLAQIQEPVHATE